MDFLKYNNQILFGEDAFEKFSKTKIFIIGADTIAQECIRCLSLMGFHNFMITDPTPINNKYSCRLLNFKTIPYSKTNSLAHYSIELAKSINPAVSIKEFKKVSLSTLINIFSLEEYKPDIILYTCDYIISISELEQLSTQFGINYLLGLNHSLFGYVYSYSAYNNILTSASNKYKLERFYENSDTIECLLENFNNIDAESVTLETEYTRLETSILYIKDKTVIVNKTPEILAFLNINSNETIYISVISKNILTKKLHFSEYIEKNDYRYVSLSQTKNNDKLYENYVSFIKKPHLIPKYFETHSMDSRFYPLSVIIGATLAHEVSNISNGLVSIEKDILFSFNELMGKNIAKSSRNIVLDYDLHINLDRDLLHTIKNKYVTIVDLEPFSIELLKNMAMLDFCQSKSSLVTVLDYSKQLGPYHGQQSLLPIDNFINNNLHNKLLGSLSEINNKLSVRIQKDISIDNSKVLSYNFWNGQDIIISGSDNKHIKLEIDNISTEYSKPFLNLDGADKSLILSCFIPNKTNTYLDSSYSREPVDNNINRSINIFNTIFYDMVKNCKEFISDKEEFFKSLMQFTNGEIIKTKLEQLVIFLELIFNPDFINTIEFIEKIYKYFHIGSVDFRKLLEQDHKIISILYQSISENIIKLPNIENLSKYISSDISYIDSNNTLSNEEIECLTNNLLSIDTEEIEDIILGINPISFDKYNFNHIRLVSVISQLNSSRQVKLLDIYNYLFNSYIKFPTSVSISASLAVCEILKYFYDKKPSYYTIERDTIISKEYSKPVEIYNGMYSENYKTRVSTIPDSFTRWKSIHINCVLDSCNTIQSLVNILESDYNIPVRHIFINGTMIYDTLEKKNMGSRLEQVIYRLSILKNKNILLGVVPFENENRPVVTPKIYLSLN